MGTSLTTGSIWKNRKTGKEFELVGHNGDTTNVQLCPLEREEGEEGYSIMTAHSLQTNYTLVATSRPKVKGEEPSAPSSEPEAPKEITSQPPRARQPGRVELADGKVIPGIRFLLDVAKKAEADTCKNTSIIFWLLNSKAGKELLEQHNAKVVHGKELTK